MIKLLKQFICLSSLGTAVLFLSGCQSYRLGHPAELPYETMFVEAVANESYAPQAQAVLSAHLREQIIRDGRVRLVAKRANADVILAVTLVSYERNVATRNSQDTEIAQDFDLMLTAGVSIYDQRENKHLLQGRLVEQTANAFLNNIFAAQNTLDTQSLVQAEHQAIPQLSRDLAVKIANEVLGTW